MALGSHIRAADQECSVTEALSGVERDWGRADVDESSDQADGVRVVDCA